MKILIDGGEKVDVPAIEVAPGLAITPRFEGGRVAHRGAWVLTHTISGKGLLNFSRKRAAITAARKLAKVLDWTKSAKELEHIPGLKVKLLTILKTAEVQDEV